MKIYVRKREKNWKKSWTWISIMSFSPHIWERGDLFTKTKYLNSSVFLPTSVNQAQDFMCLKFKSNFKYKQHPTSHHAESMAQHPLSQCKAWFAIFYPSLSPSIWTLWLGCIYQVFISSSRKITRKSNYFSSESIYVEFIRLVVYTYFYLHPFVLMIL